MENKQKTEDKQSTGDKRKTEYEQKIEEKQNRSPMTFIRQKSNKRRKADRDIIQTEDRTQPQRRRQNR